MVDYSAGPLAQISIASLRAGDIVAHYGSYFMVEGVANIGRNASSLSDVFVAPARGLVRSEGFPRDWFKCWHFQGTRDALVSICNRDN